MILFIIFKDGQLINLQHGFTESQQQQKREKLQLKVKETIIFQKFI